jgi:hypothetical protein
MKRDYVQDFYGIAQGRISAMQHAYSDFPRSQREYEHSQEAYQHFEYESRIEGGEKILPPLREKRRIPQLLWLLFIVAISLIVLIPICVAILFTSDHSFPDLTNLHLVFAIYGVLSIDAIIYLLLDRMPGKPARNGVVGRIVFAIITGFLTPVVCQMMIRGANGADGVLLVLFITISSNIVSYLALCEKRRKPSKGRD